jgi:hypothetical protein
LQEEQLQVCLRPVPVCSTECSLPVVQLSPFSERELQAEVQREVRELAAQQNHQNRFEFGLKHFLALLPIEAQQ